MMIAMVSCSKQSYPKDTAMNSSPSVKISVLKDGTILADGKKATLSDIDQAFTELKKAGGMVWYYRETGKEEPPPQAMEVIKLVGEKSLPITLSSKADFSDYIGQDGQSHPREK